MRLEKIKHNLYWKTKLWKQATCIRYALAKPSKSVQISPLTSLDSFLLKIPCRKKRERSFWCKNKKRWCSNKRYQWVKIGKSRARKVTRNFEKWISKSHAVEAPEDSIKAHVYAIEAKSVMDECKQKVVEIEKLTDTINFLKEKRKEFWFWLLIFFFWACKVVLHFFLFISYSLVLQFCFLFLVWIHKVASRKVLYIITFSEHSRTQCWGVNFCCCWEIHSNEVFLGLKQSPKITVTCFSMGFDRVS